MLAELKERRRIASLPISRFADLCNEMLVELRLSSKEIRKITPRTIRYYAQEDLLPAPTVERGKACYGYVHLLGLLAIKVCQAEFLPLRLIRQRLAGMGRNFLEQFITDATLKRAAAAPIDAVGKFTSSAKEAPVGLLSQSQLTFPNVPGVPPEVPIRPGESTNVLYPPTPMVYDEAPARVEYRVVLCRQVTAATLEKELNTLGRKGWWLVEVLPQQDAVLLVLMRRERSRAKGL